MKNYLLIFFLTIFTITIFSNSDAAALRELRQQQEEECKKSIFSRIKCKADDYNFSPTDYFKKRKKCSDLRDRADTVYQGKQLYKQCMDRYS